MQGYVIQGIRTVAVLGLLGGCGDENGGSSADDATGSGDDATSATEGDDGSDPDGGPGTSGATDTDGSGSSGLDGTSGDETGGVDPPAECGPVTTFETGLEPTQVVHVDPTGSDGNGCGAQDSPCATLDFASGLAVPGTAIRLHPGTYAGGAFIDGLQGTEAAPIWVGGAPGEARPVFDGGVVAFTLRRARYVVVHELEIQGSQANGLNIDDNSEYDNPDAAAYVVFRDLVIRDIGQGGNNDCLKLSGLDNFFVLDNDFSGCGGSQAGSGIDMVGCHDAIIAGNDFHDSPDGGNAVQTKGGSARVQIRGNRFENAGSRAINAGGATDFQYYRPSLQGGGFENAEARDIVVVSNLFIGGDAAVAFVGCVDCIAANNTIVDPSRWIFRILQESQTTPQYTFIPARNGSVFNNIVWYARNGLSTPVNVGGGTSPETFSFATNLWYAHDAPEQSDPAGQLPSPEVGGIYGTDPGFFDLAGGDYGVAAGSAADGAGTASELVVGDVNGVCYADPPALGAWAVGR